eukprot:gene1665-3219_t
MYFGKFTFSKIQKNPTGHAVQKFGWPILFSLAAIYFAFPYVKQLLREASLRHANNRHRRQILDADLKRARVRQQLDLYKANRESKP